MPLLTAKVNGKDLAMTREQWNDASFEDRCSALRRGFPFDYLLAPKPFMRAAELPFDELPANVQTGIR